MKSNEDLKLHGALTMILTKANGEIEVMHKDNMIVDSGFDFICDALAKAAGRPAVASHIAVGTGTTAVGAGQEALETELNRQAVEYNHVAGTKVFSLTATFAPGVGTGAITEAGVLNGAAGGSMLDRVVFPVINKGVDDTLAAVFTFTLS